ncbi:hypothetical protein DFH08DRAFT_946703 [Mycena albidolilacea]|uniref:Uncharacterized protein n=1 Tax=Mycena albidolilacea TaxID=1033008 RepID=A0AAD7F652_9AGAR|nr:hypothetical protein DFH08DRAFT_946703 [Mycena albidolilacea]
MPVAETIGMISGVVTVGSFVLGSVPDAASRVTAAYQQLTSKEMIDSAEKNAAFVLTILEDYGDLISDTEFYELKAAYWQHRNILKDLLVELEEQAANPVDTPRTKSFNLFKKLRAQNQKKTQKMAKEKMMRKTAERLLFTSEQVKVHARSVSDKARYREVLRNERTPVPPSSKQLQILRLCRPIDEPYLALSSSTTSATTQRGSTSPTLGALPSANDSIVSFVFDRRPSALSQTVATAGAHAPAAAGPVPQGADTAAIPLERFQTADTVHSAHTLVSPPPIAAK